MEQFDWILNAVKFFMAAGVVVCLILFVIKPMFLAFASKDSADKNKNESSSVKLEILEVKIPIKNKTPEFNRRKIIDKALENPENTTIIVRNWLTGKEYSR